MRTVCVDPMLVGCFDRVISSNLREGWLLSNPHTFQVGPLTFEAASAKQVNLSVI